MILSCTLSGEVYSTSKRVSGQPKLSTNENKKNRMVTIGPFSHNSSRKMVGGRPKTINY